MYVLLGRLFTLIPFHSDISARVNMLSAISGAFTAMLAFMVAFQLIRCWWPRDQFTGWKRAAAYIGSLVGTSMFAFSRTQWNNCIEAEVYSPAMLFVMIIIWLVLRWIDKRDEPGSDRYLLLITYMAFLSIGIHMTAFLIMPAVFLIVILFSSRLRRDFRFYLTGLSLFLIAYQFDLFLYALLGWSAIVLVAAVVTRAYVWRLPLMLCTAAIIGFTCQLYTPIRSAQKPSINMNNPSASFASFKSFIERKQYGDENMVLRALGRRGEWKNQLGNFQRMGFWGFFSEQYGINGRAFGILFVLGLLGIFEIARRRPRIGWPFFLMVLLGTVFLVWYMNFADGTRQDPLTGEGHIEVRDRDYFFTPGFILFGMAIGLGVAGLIEMARESLFARARLVRLPTMIVVSALIFLAWAPVKANFFYCDRSRNFVPYDFADNLLTSCDPNAILFIGGDNDTYPVWCLQAVYHVRPDVTAVNLSLANTAWYIKQIRDYMKIPLRWTDGQVDALRHRVGAGRRMYRIQDQVMDEILTINQWKRPVNIALTVGDDAKQYKGRDLSELMVMQGMVYRLEPKERLGAIDMEKNRDLYYNRFRYRALADTTIYLDDRSKDLSGNYATGLVLMADSLRKAGRFIEAIDVAKKALELVPFEYQTFNYLTQLYVEGGLEDSIPPLVKRVPPGRVREIYFIWGIASKAAGKREQAKSLLKATLDSFPAYADAFHEYALLLYENKEIDTLCETVRKWLVRNPGDEDARRIIQDLCMPGASDKLLPDRDS